jgi:hypothetical protein
LALGCYLHDVLGTCPRSSSTSVVPTLLTRATRGG